MDNHYIELEDAKEVVLSCARLWKEERCSLLSMAFGFAACSVAWAIDCALCSTKFRWWPMACALILLWPTVHLFITWRRARKDLSEIRSDGIQV